MEHAHAGMVVVGVGRVDCEGKPPRVVVVPRAGTRLQPPLQAGPRQTDLRLGPRPLPLAAATRRTAVGGEGAAALEHPLGDALALTGAEDEAVVLRQATPAVEGHNQLRAQG